DPGKPITLCITVEVTGDRALTLKGRVLSTFPDRAGSHTLTAKFEKLRPKQFEAVKAVLKAHASGPAMFDYEPPPLREPAAARDDGPASARPAPAAPDVAAAAVEATPEADAAPASEGGERRTAPRRAIDRRVIALGEEATRVLMGRDISIGGMRVNPNPLLKVGDDVRLAIHVGNQEIPLVVTARVHRDDGERGIVLRFHELDREATRLLDSMLDALPVIEPGDTQAASGMIVSEILAEAQ
ncbi:MAG: PilZ domain-containing protein, partial [Myxococcota bacterium]